MLESLFWMLVGIVIGWNLPQPDWAREIQDRVVKFFRELTGKRG